MRNVDSSEDIALPCTEQLLLQADYWRSNNVENQRRVVLTNGGWNFVKRFEKFLEI